MSDQVSVLVVDDNEDLLDTFAIILKRRGFNVSTAENGARAVNKYRSGHYDVTLMDIVMPEMNGVEAFQKIKEMDPGATVILMTAYSEESMIRTAQDNGAHRIVHKPIRIDQLVELIKEAASSEPILVVDDDVDICHTLTRSLKLQGYDVLSAVSGEDAILIAEEKSCRMAFIDIKLPRMDGIETFLRLKQINPDITTVMMTGYRNEVRDALEKAQKESAVTCLYKPFDPSEAIELVSRIVVKPKEKKENGNGTRTYTGS